MRLAADSNLHSPVIYLVVVWLIFDAVHKPPDGFGRFMARLPIPFFLVLPFEWMWNRVRAGPPRDA